MNETMNKTPSEKSLLDHLEQFWEAYCLHSRKDKSFDVEAFQVLSSERKIEYLRDIHRWFVGREGVHREMMEQGVVEPGFARSFSVVSNNYIDELQGKSTRSCDKPEGIWMPPD